MIGWIAKARNAARGTAVMTSTGRAWVRKLLGRLESFMGKGAGTVKSK